MQPRTPSTMSNRGRYPEEACEDDYQREETPSDDEGEDEPSYASSMSEPIAIRNRTPAGSVNGDDLNTMSISESPSFSSISSMAMDVDVVSEFSRFYMGFLTTKYSHLCPLPFPRFRPLRYIIGATPLPRLPVSCGQTNVNVGVNPCLEIMSTHFWSQWMIGSIPTRQLPSGVLFPLPLLSYGNHIQMLDHQKLATLHVSQSLSQ